MGDELGSGRGSLPGSDEVNVWPNIHFGPLF